jgi:hypothetical protein
VAIHALFRTDGGGRQRGYVVVFGLEGDAVGSAAENNYNWRKAASMWYKRI